MTRAFIIAVFISIAVAVVSCQKETLTSTGNSKYVPVIQSFLITGSDSIVVKVSTLEPYTNDTLDTVEPITGLQIYVNNLLLSEKTAGKYIYTSNSLNIKALDTFNLKLSYRNTIVTSKTIIPAKTTNFKLTNDTLTIAPTGGFVRGSGGFGGFGGSGGSSSTTLPSVNLTWDNPAKEYHYLVIQLMDTAKVPIDTVTTATSLANISTKQVTTVNQDDAYNITQQSIRLYGKYMVVLYKLNQEYYNLLSTSTSLNSNNMTNPPSNVTNGWGIFTAMSTDTLYFYVVK